MARGIPNCLTVVRIALIPFALYCQQTGTKTSLILAILLMLIAETTDLLDGHLARKHNCQTDLGKLLDPLADSLFHSTMFLAFLASGWAPLWMVALIIVRDISVAYMRIFFAYRQIVMGARLSGKVKAWSQAVAQIGTVAAYLTFLFLVNFPAPLIGWWLMLAATLVTIWSGLDYARTITDWKFQTEMLDNP